MERLQLLQIMQEELDDLGYQSIKLQDILDKSVRHMKNGKIIPEESEKKIIDLLGRTTVLREQLKKQYDSLERGDEMPDSIKVLQAVINAEKNLEERRIMVENVREKFDRLYAEEEWLIPWLQKYKDRLHRLDFKNLNQAQCLRALEPYKEYLQAVEETNPMLLYDWIGKLNGKFEKELIVYITLRKAILLADSSEMEMRKAKSDEVDQTVQGIESEETIFEEQEKLQKIGEETILEEQEKPQKMEEETIFEGQEKCQEMEEKTISEEQEKPQKIEEETIFEEQEKPQKIEEEIVLEGQEESEENKMEKLSFFAENDMDCACNRQDDTSTENCFVQNREETERKSEETSKESEGESEENRGETERKSEETRKKSEGESEENREETERKSEESRKKSEGESEESRGETERKSEESRKKSEGESEENRGETERKSEESGTESEGESEENRGETERKSEESSKESEREREKVREETERTDKENREAQKDEGGIQEAEENQEEIAMPEISPIDFAQFGGVQVEISENEQKKFGVKAFISDVKKAPISRAILQTIIRYQTANMSLLQQSANVSEVRVEKELQKLFQKGYLRKYTLAGMETLYELSPRLVKAVETNSIIFEEKPCLNYCEVQENNEGIPNLLHKYIYTRLNANFGRNKDVKYKRINCMYKDGVCIDVKYIASVHKLRAVMEFKEKIQCPLCFFSMLLDADVTTNAVWQNSLYVLGRERECKTMVVAGWNWEQTWKIANRLTQWLEQEMESKKIYCYVCQDDKILDYPSGNETTWNHILNENNQSISSNEKQEDVVGKALSAVDSEKEAISSKGERDLHPKSESEEINSLPKSESEEINLPPKSESEEINSPPKSESEGIDLRPKSESEEIDLRPKPESEETDLSSKSGLKESQSQESNLENLEGLSESNLKEFGLHLNSDLEESSLSCEYEPELEETDLVWEGGEKQNFEEEILSEEFAITVQKDMSREEVIRNAQIMLAYEKFYAAAAFLKSISFIDEEVVELYKKVAYAVNDPEEEPLYTSDNIFQVYTRETEENHYYFVAATLRNYFLNDMEHDYSAKSLYTSVSSLTMNSTVSNILYQLYQFKTNVGKGIDVYADYRDQEMKEWQERKRKVVREATDAYNQYIANRTSENTSNRRFVLAKNLAFAEKEKLAILLKNIMEDGEELETIKTTLYAYFIKDNASIRLINLDRTKVDQFIDYYWDLAAGKMNNVKKTSDLMSSLRGNFYNNVERVVEIVCKWVELMESRKTKQNDIGIRLYQQVRTGLMENMRGAITSLQEEWSQAIREKKLRKAAGVKVLEATLQELWLRLEGSYQENAHNYFYIDFLRDSNVLLTSTYRPDWKGLFWDLEDFSMPVRICRHFNLQMRELTSFHERLNEIFNCYGDDYGSAYLILSYLVQTKQDDWSMDEVKTQIREYSNYAREDAISQKMSFLENLELAKSYGQIDNSYEDRKEQMIQFAHEWWEYSVETQNYGFFKQVLQKYEEKIHHDARQRGERLRYDLEQWKKKNPDWRESQHCIRRMEKIEEMLKIQNYTGAEDILNRMDNWESEEGFHPFDQDILQEFLDSYDYHYQRVSVLSKTLSSLTLSSSHSNKYTRGGKRLLESWLSNGGYLGEVKLQSLLQNLGFDVESVRQQPRTNKKESYWVKLKKPINGKKSNFKHCIAAFGSQAMVQEFYVICSYGRFNTDDLVDMYHSLGSAKTILVLLDYALSLPERRKLARKIKQKGTNTVFAVLDRVMLMFLADNYNESAINRMLMLLVMPFSYYQPYVMNEVLPPELFMGREDELNKIVSPDGVNIVYGGRQLGKSALLQMAKTEVNHNENHDRAIVVNIKGLNYREAARKIGFSLYEEHILQEELNTENWNELAHVIRRRLLLEEEPYIPYLLLMLDEADIFIESCVDVNYQPFDALKEVQNIGMGRFKFVVAGLRNIVRFHREVALGNNSVITQLKSLIVKPFQVKEARELLEVPLYYLGMRFLDDRTVLMILANTNYFPGLIQLYCAKLIETLKGSAYECYNESDTPPYRICENHIKKVLEDGEVNRQIREKFEITLELDSDNYYKIIALLLAHLCHTRGMNMGYSAREIWEECNRYEIECLMCLRIEQVEALMDELCELNVFRKSDGDKYLYYRYNFFQMMGSASDVEEKILQYMEN